MCVHNGGDVPRVVGIQQHVAGQVHRHRLTLALALPAYSGKLLVVGVQQHVAGQVHRHRLTLALALPGYSGKLLLMHGNTEKLAAHCGTGTPAPAHPRSRSHWIQRKITSHALEKGGKLSLTHGKREKLLFINGNREKLLLIHGNRENYLSYMEIGKNYLLNLKHYPL